MRILLRLCSTGIAIALWLSLPAMLPGHGAVLVLLTLYVPIVVGITLLAGYTGQVSVGQAAFFGTGAYVTGILSVHAGVSPWAAMPLAVVAAAAIAWVIGTPVLMLRGQYVVLATLGFNVIFTVLATQLDDLTGGASGLVGIQPLSLGETVLLDNGTFYVMGSALAAVSVLLSQLLVRSRIGRALQAIEGSEAAAATLGVNRRRHATQVFVWSAALAASSGALYAEWVRFISPTAFTVGTSIDLLIMAVVGGINSIWGAVVGTATLLALRELLRDLVPQLAGDGAGGTAEYELVAFGLILALTVIYLPGGVWPWLTSMGRRVRPPRPARSAPAARSTPEPAAPTARETLATGVSTGPALRVEGLSQRFGGLAALEDVSISVERGTVLAVIGPNGAGKTTFVNALSGMVVPSAGRIEIDGESIGGLAPHRVAETGVARTFQTPRLFPLLDVGDNVRIGLHRRLSSGFVRSLLGLNRIEERRGRRRAADALGLVGASELLDSRIANLTFAQMRLVELARAMAAQPRLLLLDEPASGLAPAEREQLKHLVRSIRDLGTTVVIVEHDIPMVMDLADRILVLHHGVKLAEGTPEEVARNERVVAAYLGNRSTQPSAGRTVRSAPGPLLELSDVRAGYGAIRVLDGVDLHVGAGEVVGLLGPNGAGKTTLTRAVVGLLPATGSRTFDGHPIASSGPARLASRGLVLVPEGRELLPGLTVDDHLLLGHYVRRRDRLKDDLERVHRLFPVLAERGGAPAESLSGGQQQMLAIARALMSRPRLLIVDEPLLGLAPLVVDDILRAICQLADEGVGVLLVEQNATTVLGVLDRVHVLEQGQIVYSGSPERLSGAGDLRTGLLATPLGETTKD